MALNVEADILFLEWQKLYETEKPFRLFVEVSDTAEDKRETNLVFKPFKVEISDSRPTKSNFTLDDHGFIYRNVDETVTSFSSFTNRKAVDEEYLPMMESFLKKHVDGVDRVFFFDWRLRRNMGAYSQDKIDLSDFTTPLLPVMQAHNDQSSISVVRRVVGQLPDEAEQLLKGRVRVINVWRPLNHKVEDYPLAVCDGSSAKQEDMIEADHIRRIYSGSTLFALHNAGQKWHYMSNQEPQEAILMKLFDSEDHKAKICPHSSFRNPLSPPNALPRESFEVRALVFTYV